MPPGIISLRHAEYTFHQRRIDPSVYDVNFGCFEDLFMAAFQDVPIEDGVSLLPVHQ